MCTSVYDRVVDSLDERSVLYGLITLNFQTPVIFEFRSFGLAVFPDGRKVLFLHFLLEDHILVISLAVAL